jgi:hypothetical protein
VASFWRFGELFLIKRILCHKFLFLERKLPKKEKKFDDFFWKIATAAAYSMKREGGRPGAVRCAC